MKLTKEIKSNWLAALRSGEYTQDRRKLRTEKGHCCLGVLAEIEPSMTISESGHSLVGYSSTGTYSKGFDRFLGICTNELVNTNDKNCDGAFTSVIPLIEALETVD